VKYSFVHTNEKKQPWAAFLRLKKYVRCLINRKIIRIMSLMFLIVTINCMMLQKMHAVIEKRDETKESVELTKLPSEIRVLIHTTDYKALYHPNIEMYIHGEYTVTSKRNVKKISDCFIKDEDVKLERGEKIRFIPVNDSCYIEMKSITRDSIDKYPCYHGSMEVERREKGYIVINQLPIEMYLYGVIPSEMPSDYPMEALKAQAICARTYAYRSIQEKRMKEFEADVDDSTSFQVYQNVEETLRTKKAVDDTKG